MEDDKFNALVESHDLALMDYHGQTVLHITGKIKRISFFKIHNFFDAVFFDASIN